MNPLIRPLYGSRLQHMRKNHPNWISVKCTHGISLSACTNQDYLFFSAAPSSQVTKILMLLMISLPQIMRSAIGTFKCVNLMQYVCTSSRRRSRSLWHFTTIWNLSRAGHYELVLVLFATNWRFPNPLRNRIKYTMRTWDSFNSWVSISKLKNRLKGWFTFVKKNGWKWEHNNQWSSSFKSKYRRNTTS